MPESTFQRSFESGELAPELHARADHEKYLSGARTCRNFMVLRHGAVANRSGFRFVGATKTASSNVRLQKFISSTPNSHILVEVGVSYFRFYKNGALISLAGAAAAYSGATNYIAGDLVSSGGVNYYAKIATVGNAPPNATFWHPLTGLIYEVPHTYTTTGLIGAWEQSGNTILITHRLHDPRELVYFSDTNWVLRLATTAPATVAPLTLALVAGGVGTVAVAYVVTAAALETYEESLVSNVASDSTSATPTEAVPNALTWAAPTDPVEEYYVYKDLGENGVFGYIGTARGIEAFKDTGIAPDYTLTPPLARTPFVSAETRPHTGTHYQQRRFYGGSNAEPDRVDGSRTGFVNNFAISSPLQDDDALTFRLIGKQQQAIRHMIGLKRLLLFTDGGIWTVGEPNRPLTPSSLGGDQETYAGVDPDVPPVAIGNTVVYVQTLGSILRDVQFDQQVEGLNGRDLTLFASHLVEGRTIERMDFAEAPHSIVWAVRSDGTLLGLTYIRELNVYGWHRHDTDGAFEQVCTVPEATGDAVYVVVARTIGGATVRYIERLASRVILTFDVDAFFVDSGLSYTGAPVTTVSGLGHLEGKIVAIVADGAVVSNGDPAATAPYIVTAGAVTIPTAASNIHVGLPIRFADLETLDLDVRGSVVRDKQKRTGSMYLIVDKSSRSFYAGPDSSNLTPHEISSIETAADEHTGMVEMALKTGFNLPGRIFIRQIDPLPLTIIGIMPNMIVGG